MSDDDIERIGGDINNLRGDVQELTAEVRVLVSKSHTPQDCPLSKEVKALQLHEARQAGALAVVGTISALIASAIVTFIAKMGGK